MDIHGNAKAGSKKSFGTIRKALDASGRYYNLIIL